MKMFFRKLMMQFPSSLPQGVEELKSWSESIIDAYDVPNNASTHFSLATMILHLGQVEARKPKAYFGAGLRKAAANEVAAFVMQDLKAKQKAAMEAAQKAAAPPTKPAEATGSTEPVASNEQSS